MKIIYLFQYFHTPQMSGGTRAYEMARRLVQHGHEVEMITSDKSGRTGGWYATNEAGIRVHWCPVPYSNYMSYNKRIRSFLKFAWKAAKKAASLQGDVVFASSTPLTIALPAVYAARKLSVPMVFEVRDLWPNSPIVIGVLKNPIMVAAARRLERFAYRNSQRIVTLSPFMQKGVVKTGFPIEKTTVIPNACDTELFRVDPKEGQAFRNRHPWLQDRPLVVYTGAMGKVNGVHYLANLAAAVAKRDPEFRFLIVGNGCEEGKVRRVAIEKNVLDRNFFMHPRAQKIEMPAILSAADIAVSTVVDCKALWGDSANKVFDAMAADRPFAINHGGPLAEVIHETGCGLVLDTHDMELAAEQLVSAIRDPNWCSRARIASGRLADGRFNRDRLAGKLEAILQELVSPTQDRIAA